MGTLVARPRHCPGCRREHARARRRVFWVCPPLPPERKVWSTNSLRGTGTTGCLCRAIGHAPRRSRPQWCGFHSLPISEPSSIQRRRRHGRAHKGFGLPLFEEPLIPARRQDAVGCHVSTFFGSKGFSIRVVSAAQMGYPVSAFFGSKSFRYNSFWRCRRCFNLLPFEELSIRGRWTCAG